MKPLRYAFFLFAVTVCVVTPALAGGDHCQKSASGASAANGCCSATKGTAATSAAMAAAAKHGGCPASAQCPMSSAQCQAMVSSGACTAEMRAQCAKGASATVAAAGQCTRNASQAHISCAAHGGATAAAGCAAQGACDVCADEASCDADVRATGARAQVVSLRNGVMFVYTADGAASIRALQAVVARHNARVLAVLSGQGDAKLCGDCKQMRGAMASGKFVREVVNVERGCQVLLTSSDRSIVDRIHTMANTEVAARVRD